MIAEEELDGKALVDWRRVSGRDIESYFTASSDNAVGPLDVIPD